MSHVHRHLGGPDRRRPLTIVLVLTCGYLIVEVIAGWLTHSLALLADAGHMLTDVAGLGLALTAMAFAVKPATPDHTYGYYRFEILASVVNAVVLLLISFFILYEAYGRLRHPPEIASGPVLVVAVIGLVVNLVGARLLRSGAPDSLNVKGAYLEVVADLMSSAGVVVAAVVMWATGWYYADPLVSAGIGLFILPRTWRLLTEGVGVLLEGTPANVDLAKVRDRLNTLTGVAGVRDLHAWSLTSGRNALSVHLVRDADTAHDDLLVRAQRLLTGDLHFWHVTIQVESIDCGAYETHL